MELKPPNNTMQALADQAEPIDSTAIDRLPLFGNALSAN
jgi:hypothetical protein